MVESGIVFYENTSNKYVSSSHRFACLDILKEYKIRTSN